METFESFLKRVKLIVIDSLSGIDRSISNSDMVLQFLSLLPSAYKPIKERILSKSPLPTFHEACHMVYKYKLELEKDPVRPIRTDPRTPKHIVVAAETAKTLGDVVDTAGKIGDAVDLVGKLGAPVGAAVSSVASTAGAIGPLGAPIKLLGLVIFGGWKLWQRRSRN